MRMRLIYNGAELTSDTGVPLSQIAVASGLPDLEEACLSELVDALGRLGVTSISI